MLAQLFSYLIGESAEWGAIVRLITEMAKPLIGAFNELLRALWPVIQIVLGVLRSAFGTLASIVGGVVAPVFKAVAGVIASVWNAFARAINWALGWLGVNLPTINAGGGGSASGTVFANSAAASLLGGKGKATQGLPGGLGGGIKGLGGKGSKGLPSGLGVGKKGMSKLTGLKTPKMSTGAGKAMGKGIAKGGGVKMPKPKGAGKGGGGAPKMPKGNAPKPPKISSPKPTDIKTPDSNMGGGTKVSEITGPTRDLFLDLLSPLAALPELIGIGNRMVDLLAGGATLSPVAIAAPGIGGRIENLTINLPPSPVPYDARRIALEIQPYLGRAHKTSVRGRGGK